MKSALEELKVEKIRIFEDKSELINNLRNEIESLNKQLSEQTRKSIINGSVIKNHESEMEFFKEKIEVLELERSETK